VGERMGVLIGKFRAKVWKKAKAAWELLHLRNLIYIVKGRLVPLVTSKEGMLNRASQLLIHKSPSKAPQNTAAVRAILIPIKQDLRLTLLSTRKN